MTSDSALVQAHLGLVGRVGDAEGSLTDLNTVNVSSDSALVQAHLALTGRVGDAEGSLTQIDTVDVSSTSALVQSHLALNGRVGDAEGSIEQVNTVDVSSSSAIVQAHLGLSATITDPETGLASAHAGVEETKDAQATANNANAIRFSSVEAQIGDAAANPPTGFHGKIQKLEQAVGDENGGLVQQIGVLSATLSGTGPNTIRGDIGSLKIIVGDGDSGLVADVQSARATLAAVNGDIVGTDSYNATLGSLTATKDSLGALQARVQSTSAFLGTGNILAEDLMLGPSLWAFQSPWSLIVETVDVADDQGVVTTQKVNGFVQYAGSTGTTYAQTSTLSPVEAGQVYTVQADVIKTATGPVQIILRVVFFDGKGDVLAAGAGQQFLLGDAVYRFEDSYTAPLGAVSAKARISASGSGSARFGNVQVRNDRVRGEIYEFAASRVTASEAVSAVEQTVSAQFGSLAAMAQTLTTTKATVDGIEASYVLRLNGSNVLEAVSVGDGTDGGSVVTARLSPDYLQITGLTQIDTAVIADLASSNALIDNLTLGRGQIVDDLRSDNYAEDANGKPTSGLKLNFATGEMKAAGAVISRQIKVAAGRRAISAASVVSQGGADIDADDWSVPLKTYWVDQTNVPLTAWMQPDRTYLVTGSLAATVSGAPGKPPDVYWGVVGTLMPLTRWDGNQSMRLKLDVWARHVTGWSAGFVDWTIYEVT